MWWYKTIMPLLVEKDFLYHRLRKKQQQYAVALFEVLLFDMQSKVIGLYIKSCVFYPI